MKTLFTSFVLGAVVCMQPLFADNPEAKITVHVVDDQGHSLTNFPVMFQAYVGWTPGEGFGAAKYSFLTTNTDTDGKVTATAGLYSREFDIRVGKIAGYYGGGIDYNYTNAVAGKWQPWNPTVEFVVKPILNPISMYAININLNLPAKNEPVGFDLEARDWVAPYGKGSVADFVFTVTEKVPFVNYHQPFDVLWTLSFSNKGDGFQSVPVSKNAGSALRLPRNAPESGYQPTLVQEISRNGNQGSDGANGDYFFRVRTVLDEQGTVKSALYGKIAGTLQCWGDSKIHMIYYLNPTPNDRNMEFDPSKNLFQNLTDDQQVQAP